MKRFTLRKEERLRSRKIIEALFTNKTNSFAYPPLRALWMETSQELSYPIQIAFSVPLKNFPKAVDRNRIKRLMREAYRLNKFILHDVLKGKKKQVALMLMWGGKEVPDYSLVSGKIIVTLNRLAKRYATSE